MQGSKYRNLQTKEHTVNTIETMESARSILKSADNRMCVQSTQSKMDDKEKSMLTTTKTSTLTEINSNRFGSQIIDEASEAGVFNNGSLEGVYSAILPNLFLSGWRLMNHSLDLIRQMQQENRSSCHCVNRCFKESRSHNATGNILECPHVTDKEIEVLLSEMVNAKGTQLRNNQSIARSESTEKSYDEVCESRKHSLESLDLSPTSQETIITNLPDSVSSRSSARRTSMGTSRFPVTPEHQSTVNVHLSVSDNESCNDRQPSTVQRSVSATSPKPARWRNSTKRGSFTSNSWMSVVAAIFILVPSNFAVAQQVLHPSKPVQSNFSITPTTLHVPWSPIGGLSHSHNEVKIKSAIDTTNSLNPNKSEVLKQHNKSNSQDFLAMGNSNRDVTSKFEDHQQTDVFYHDPVAALPEEEIYLPPEIYDTGFWDHSNDTFYKQEENINDRDQGNLNYIISTTEDPFFRFFQTEMIAEHSDTSDENRTQEDYDPESRNTTDASENILDYSFGNYNNKADINNIHIYKSHVESDSGVNKYVTKDEHETHNKQAEIFRDDKHDSYDISHILEGDTTRSHRTVKELNAAVTRETNHFKPETPDNVFDFGKSSGFQVYANDFPKNTESQKFVNDISSNEMQQDYVNDNLKSLGPPDYVNDDPHVTPSKFEDENFHQSPSAGLWGHEVLSSPQWSHYPKIYRGMKRDKVARKTMKLAQNKGGARILASSHYELQYILGRKIIFLCVARGRPRPRITWFKDGVELYAHNYFQVHEWDIGRFKLKSKMEIDPATPMDAGYYKCEANNEQGIDQAGFRTKYRIQ